jgi:hypothetical protein
MWPLHNQSYCNISMKNGSNVIIVSWRFKFVLKEDHNVLSGPNMLGSNFNIEYNWKQFLSYHCVVYSSLIYRFWLPLWYLQTLLTYDESRWRRDIIIDFFVSSNIVNNVKFLLLDQSLLYQKKCIYSTHFDHGE